MTLVLPDTGELIALKALFNNTAGQDVKIKLFTNNITPSESDTAGTYTEANFTGYAALTLLGANWTFTGGAPSSASYAQQTFASTANQATQQVYGYFVVQATSGTLLYAERFPAGPYPIANNGDQILVTPTFTAD